MAFAPAGHILRCVHLRRGLWDPDKAEWVVDRVAGGRQRAVARMGRGGGVRARAVLVGKESREDSSLEVIVRASVAGGRMCGAPTKTCPSRVEVKRCVFLPGGVKHCKVLLLRYQVGGSVDCSCR